MNGDPVLFSVINTTKGGASYAFTCTVCDRRYAEQPDTACPDCAKPAKPAKPAKSSPSRRRAVKSRAR